MTDTFTEQSVPHSLGSNRPAHSLPALACDSHMHIFDPRFPPSAHWPRTPPRAEVEMYRLLQRRLGTSRAVVVTPSTYGTDNECTLDALQQMGESARGVAVVAHDVADAQLDRLARHRVCGLRVNFVSPQAWGETTPEMLNILAHRIARQGWHVQIFVEPDQLVALAPVLKRLPVPLVIDHMARIAPHGALQNEAYKVLRDLVAGGNTWVKLSGAYMRSQIGEPSYADVLPLGRALVCAAPGRMVWGSDWPHTTQPSNTVNDASLIGVLHAWCDLDDSLMDTILVVNPAQLYGFGDC